MTVHATRIGCKMGHFSFGSVLRIVIDWAETT